MGIEHIGRLVIFNDTQANVEAVAGDLAEIVFGRNTATGEVGYSIDDGANWTWLPTANISFNDAEGDPVAVDVTAAADGTSEYAARRDHRHSLGDVDLRGKYRQFVYTVSGGDFTFVIDDDGNPVMALQELEE